MALREDIRRIIGSKASSKVAKPKNVLKGDVEFDVCVDAMIFENSKKHLFIKSFLM